MSENDKKTSPVPEPPDPTAAREFREISQTASVVWGWIEYEQKGPSFDNWEIALIKQALMREIASRADVPNYQVMTFLKSSMDRLLDQMQQQGAYNSATITRQANLAKFYYDQYLQSLRQPNLVDRIIDRFF